MSASEVRVSGAALRANLRALTRLAGGVGHTVPVVKANAYGHGIEPVVRALKGQTPRAFAVAHASEALALRRLHRGRILVLSAWEADDARRAIAQGIELVAWDRKALRTLARFGTVRRPAPVHLKIDSGTGRLGTRPEAAAAFLREAVHNPRVALRGVFTHFADAEEETDGYTLRQLRAFEMITKDLPHSVERHAACTASLLRFPTTRLDFVRIGIGLYGLWPSQRSRRLGVRLRPALEWVTTVQQVKHVPTGTTVGYGRAFRTRRRSSLAVLPVGYADGYPRALSNAGFVSIGSRLCPIVGRVSMNLIVVDATNATVRPGSPVTVLGGQGRGGVPAEDLAERAGTLAYELVTRIAVTVPRKLV